MIELKKLVREVLQRLPDKESTATTLASGSEEEMDVVHVTRTRIGQSSPSAGKRKADDSDAGQARKRRK